jgi:hypothetical protein
MKMPPRGGPRQATKILATNATNPDDVHSYDSLTATAKALDVCGHSTVKRALQKGTILNGYYITLLPISEDDTDNNLTEVVSQNHTEFTFFDEVDDMFKGQKIRYTKEQPIQVSVLDVIRVITGTTNPHLTYSRLQLQYTEVLTNCEIYQFSGAGERLTPVCSVQTMIELINLLPGQRAARFRQAGAKVLVRVLGGDETLIDEIRENATKMELATETEENSPMCMFQLPEGLTGVNAVCSVMLSPSMQGKTVADFRKPCTYLIVFNHNDQVAIKFGWTKNLKERVREHYNTYPDMKVWCALNCKTIECADGTERLFKGKMSAYLQTIQVEKKNGDSKPSTEVLFNVTPEKAEEQMRDAFDTVSTECSVSNDLEIKDKEIKKLELELAKFNTILELKRLGVDVSVLLSQCTPSSSPCTT